MSNVHISQHPIIAQLVTELRDKKTKQSQFRALVRKISTLLAFEATSTIRTDSVQVETPLMKTSGVKIIETIGIVPILRAGLGMTEGFLDLLLEAQVWHLGLFRDERTLKPVTYYNRLPDKICVSLCFLVDPMLATGESAVASCDILKKWGTTRIIFVGLIGAPEGVKLLQHKHPDVDIYLAALDERLTGSGDPWPSGYILPGLGDAGDRQFGTGNHE